MKVKKTAKTTIKKKNAKGSKTKNQANEAQLNQGLGKCGHHSDYIIEIPKYLLDIPNKYETEIDIMIEAKMKEKAILKLYEIYPELNCRI